MARQPAAPRWPDLEAEVERLERDLAELRDEMRRLADARAGDRPGHPTAHAGDQADDLREPLRDPPPDRHADTPHGLAAAGPAWRHG